MRRTRSTVLGLGAGAAGALVLAVLAALGTPGFFFGYLAALVAVWAVPLGAGGVLLLHHLTGGAWGWRIRPMLHVGLYALPVVALGFLPVLVGLDDLYRWADPQAPIGPELEHKDAYLNVTFFLVRAAILFGVWTLGAVRLLRPRVRRARTLAVGSAGAILYVLTASFAAVDWIGSLEVVWYSTIIGMYVVTSQVLATLAIVVLAAAATDGARGRFDTGAWRDTANLLFTFVILHGYMAFSQWIVTWYGNRPHEIAWYLPRIEGAWWWVAAAMAVLQFAVPFGVLLVRTNKTRPRVLAGVACTVLAGHVVEAFWMVAPSWSAPDGAAGDWGAVALVTVVAALTLAALGAAAAGFGWARLGGYRDLERGEAVS